MKNQTVLKPNIPSILFKNWKVGYLLMAMVPLLLFPLLLYPFSAEKMAVLFSFKILSKFILVYIMIIFTYFVIGIQQKTALIIDEKGIRQTFAGGFAFKDMEFQYNWNNIQEIKVSQWSSSVEVKLISDAKKKRLSLFLWVIDSSSVELNIPKMPKTNYGRAKFNINNTAIVKAINHWKPKELFSEEIKLQQKSYNTVDLGDKIKYLAIASFFAIFVFLMSMPFSDEIHLYSGYYWKMWMIFAYVYLMIALLITLKEIKDKYKMAGAIVVSLLVAACFATATGGLLDIYTKWAKITGKHTFELIDKDDKKMIWKSTHENWSKFFMKYENDFERNIEIGASMEMDVNKGPFEIYSTSIENFDKAAKKFDNKKSN
jgi:hypothetical protein